MGKDMAWVSGRGVVCGDLSRCMAVQVWNSHIAVAVASPYIVWGTCASPNRWSLCYNLDIAVLGLVSDEVGCRRGIE